MTGAEETPRRVALSHGYGAGLLGMTDDGWRTSAEAFVRATRREAELLRPDLLVIDAGATALAAALGCPTDEDERGRGRATSPRLAPAEWATWEAPATGDHPALVAVITAAVATARDTPTAIAVPGPASLARLLADRPAGPEPDERDDFEELVDTATFAILDLVDAIPATSPVHLVVREDLSHHDGPATVEALRSIRRVLHHRSRRLVTWVQGTPADVVRWRGDLGQDPADVIVVWRDPDGPSWDDLEPLAVVATDTSDVAASGVALELDRASDPERVQAWAGGRAADMTTMTKEQQR